MVQNLKKQNSSWKTYIHVFHRLRVKVQVKILAGNSKQGSFITFWLVVNSKAKMILIGSFFSIRFSFINPLNPRFFSNFRKKTGNFAVLVCCCTFRCQKYAWFYSKFKAQSNELIPGFPHLQEVVQNLKKQNSSWKMYIYVIRRLRVNLFFLTIWSSNRFDRRLKKLILNIQKSYWSKSVKGFSMGAFYLWNINHRNNSPMYWHSY